MAAEVGVAYVNIIPKTDNFSSQVASASSQAGESGAKSIGNSLMNSLKSTFGDLFGTGSEMGAKLSGGMESFLSGAGKMAIVGAVAAIGVEALRELESIGAEIDAMTDEIIVGTGKSGEALEGLKQTAMNVSTDVPVGFAKSGDIIQDFSTRLGLSGDKLEEVAGKAAQLDYVLGGINYDSMATMFNVWGVSADDMSSKMDYMFGVVQNTGIGFDSLSSIMRSAGPTLQNLGFSFEESANMAGLLDKAGIDASTTMSRMSKALVNLSEPGESAQDAFRRVVDEMQGYIDAGDTASAMNIAEELFGTRGAAQFIGALQSGALNMDALSDSALGASGSIEGTYEATKSWPEQWELIKTRVQAALEPLGSAVFSALGGILDTASEAMTGLWQASEPLRAKIAELAAGIGRRLQPVIDALSPALSALADGALTVVGGAFQFLADTIGNVANVVSFVWDSIMAFGAWLSGTFGPLVDGVTSAVESAFSTMGSVLTAITQGIYGFMSSTWSAIQGTVTGIVNGIRGAVSSAWSAIQSVTSGVMSSIRSIISGVWSGIQGIVSGAVGAIRGVINGLSSLIGGVASTFNSIYQAIAGPINEAKSIVSSAISTIEGIFSGAHLELPHISLPHFNIDGGEVPWGIGGEGYPPSISISWYAHGGIVDGARLIGVGEAGPEMILPRAGGIMDDFSDAVTAKVDNEAIVREIRALKRELGEIIAESAPTATPRELRRINRKVAAYA